MQPNKKICFYISTIKGGGAARVMVLIAEGLARRGYQCILVTSFRDSNWEYPLSNQVRRLILDKEGESENRVLQNLRRIGRLRRICKNEKPNCLITFLPIPILRSLMATIGLNVKNIISIRNDPALYWRKSLERALSSLLLRRVYWAVFQTEAARNHYAGKELHTKSQVIANPIKNIFYATEYNPNSKKVVACGRLDKQKNYPMMIDAFAEVVKEYPEWTLEIYGEGPLEEDIKNRIQNLNCSNIHLMGQNDNIPRVLSDAGIFLLTSNVEGMPNALMEAMAAGVPCISTDCPCGGPKQLISDKENGFLIPVNGKDELCKVLIDLMNNKDKRIRISQKASLSASSYKEDAIIEKWEQLLSSL